MQEVKVPLRVIRRLVLRCRLCDPRDGLLVEPSGERPILAAVDHALDEHRELLISDREAVLGALSVAA
ncbi:hypothetical protein [Pseudonocardia sp. TRM90224]|uniref:hypothetical protein n=1 Tax=Pseudonocardia sp. TRM90224 TaxID=2812678 RepID=UPI001E495EDD|nr:hypothetical protein [Pseudonocardia sp. TRM90224]